MEDFRQAVAVFGPWDWACVALNLSAAFAGVFALRSWQERSPEGLRPGMSATDAALAVLTGLTSFSLLFGLVTGLAKQSFQTIFGISLTHVFTSAFLGQSAAIAAMLTMSLVAPATLSWAPARNQADETGDFRRARQAFSLPRIGMVMLCLLALGVALTAAWKGVHFGWEQLALRGITGPAPADEPQEIVDIVLRTDVGTWTFAAIALAVTVGAPIMEELAFRGMLYPGLRRLGEAVSARHARWLAVVLTGALFSAAHLSASAALPLFGFGAFMCLVRDRHGLLACMAAHACFNGWNLLWLKLAPAAANL